MITLREQRQVGILFTGFALGITSSALINWSRKHPKNRNVILQLYSILLSAVANILMFIIAHEILNDRYGKPATIASFLANNCSDFQQYFLTYFSVIRFESLIYPRNRRATWGIRSWAFLIVALYFIDHLMTYIAMAKCNMENVATFIQSYYFNSIGKSSAMAGLFLYLVMVLVVDIWLIVKIRDSQKTLTKGVNLQASHTQIAIIIMCVVVKLAESAFKLVSVLTTYGALDSYIRGITCAIEIWSITELGVTVEEIMKVKRPGQSSDPPSQETREGALADDPTNIRRNTHKSPA
ncbi:uncharacterized protein SPPG_07826 [Spizellomyces punctatus DAOM BR117]|uniref:G-protein coupled receptors family 1 profile domain-containing protein n=1 Tax=Spizellomyces punctatus (strain DAOM BR117) TaxID=645134 RepID=A0A0L0H679_SPIPD|nr:uncharacterized protein SPPG_07826 [Spizellomyces punctatus DAOM BR117]KNC97010.1 hypothetical protein SPPG_07826 [Spizellomyces punctatus DAOM BR117]|eukprot:XP_016605050.1 hypothetical protein SPPG_07826 [Spizellomyces punctatus DAOM BR117]